MTKEDKETLRKCWVMTTDHTLDEEDIKLKKAITNVLDEVSTPEEKSRWGYEYYLEHHQYNDDLDCNMNFLKDWAETLKGMGNRNYPYIYAIEKVLKELNALKKYFDKGGRLILSIEEIENKLEQTEDEQTTINLLYQKVDLLEGEIGQLKTDKQKLIGKLEETRNNLENDGYVGYADEIQEILEIAKEEK